MLNVSGKAVLLEKGGLDIQQKDFLVHFRGKVNNLLSAGQCSSESSVSIMLAGEDQL